MSNLRLPVLKFLLNVLFGRFEQCQVKETVENDLVSQLLLHFDLEPKLSSVQLQQLINAGVEELKSPDSLFKCKWLCVMSKLLSLCTDHDKMPQLSDEHEISGAEFRLCIIKSLCIRNQWKGDNLPQLVKMLREISALSKAEMEEIFTNLIQVEVKRLEPEQVPPLVYQVLRLTSDNPAWIVRFVLLSSKYYNQIQLTQDSQQDSDELINSTRFSMDSMKRSESISMVHFSTEARTGHPVVKEVIKMLKTGLNIPDFVVNPFMLKLCLCFTSLKHFRPTLVDGLKSVLNRVVQNELRQKANAWFAEEIGKIPNCKDLLYGIVSSTCKYGSWELIGDGIVDLALALLDINAGLAGKPEYRLRYLWSMSQIILQWVVKNKMGVAEPIIKQLGKRILHSKAACKYTDALGGVISEASGELMNKTGALSEILQSVVNLTYTGGKRVLLSLIPIIKCSTGFRDQTILVIRKALFSPRMETRRIAINGVLALLKHFKISSGAISMSSTQAILSQSSSGLSQVVVDVHSGKSVSNEALCLELLGVLKRGFTQRADVRMSLYQGLYDVVVRNHELCPKVLQMLYQHAVKQGLTNAAASICPVDVSDIVSLQDGAVLIKVSRLFQFNKTELCSAYKRQQLCLNFDKSTFTHIRPFLSLPLSKFAIC